jgi:hypothetical protein
MIGVNPSSLKKGSSGLHARSIAGARSRRSSFFIAVIIE